MKKLNYVLWAVGAYFIFVGIDHGEGEAIFLGLLIVGISFLLNGSFARKMVDEHRSSKVQKICSV